MDLKLQQELKTTLALKQDGGKRKVLAHLGQGVHLPVDIEENPLIIVSSGLKESPQDWQSDSGLYMQLNRDEAMAFAEKKVDVLKR